MGDTNVAHTDDEGLFGLGSVLVVPWWPSGGVDGARAGAEERRLRLTLRRALPARGVHRGEEPIQRVLATATVTSQKTKQNDGKMSQVW